jgi:hypothetical protein
MLPPAASDAVLISSQPDSVAFEALAVNVTASRQRRRADQ